MGEVLRLDDFRKIGEENSHEALIKLEPERSWFVNKEKFESVLEQLDLGNRERYEIKQGYIKNDEILPEEFLFLHNWRLRVQVNKKTKEVKYLRTKKQQLTQDVLSIEEMEFDNLSESEFWEYWKFTENRNLGKTRYYIPCDTFGNILEVGKENEADYFLHLDVITSVRGKQLKPGKYIIRVEVEGKTIEHARAFQVPSWFGPEITGRREFSNRNLTKRKSRKFFKHGWEKYIAN
jgi:hypothetical protein